MAPSVFAALKGRVSCRSRRTGNTSPGCTSRLGTITEPFPDGKRSCASTRRVRPAIGRVLVLRRTSEACRSRAMEAPRTRLVLGARLNDTVRTGESRGNSTSSHRDESESAGRATLAEIRAPKMAPSLIQLLRIHGGDGYLARVRIHVSGFHSGRARDRDDRGPRVHEGER